MTRSDEYLLRALVDHVNGGRVWTDDLGERINLAYLKVSFVEETVLIHCTFPRRNKATPKSCGLFTMLLAYTGE